MLGKVLCHLYTIGLFLIKDIAPYRTEGRPRPFYGFIIAWYDTLGQEDGGDISI